MPSRPIAQACRNTSSPMASVCSLQTIPADERTSSFPSLALRSPSGSDRKSLPLSSSRSNAREQAHSPAVPAHDQPIAVMFDLVHPVRPRLGGEGGNAGLDKAFGENAPRDHSCEIAP